MSRFVGVCLSVRKLVRSGARLYGRSSTFSKLYPNLWFLDEERRMSFWWNVLVKIRGKCWETEWHQGPYFSRSGCILSLSGFQVPIHQLACLLMGFRLDN